MGLFDMFQDGGEEMTPHLAFATSLIYMIAADGEVQNEEIGQLLSVLGGKNSSDGTIGVGAQNRKLLDSANKYVQKHSVNDFINEANPKLSDGQKMCMLVNLCDSLLADGNADPAEQKMFSQFLQGFGVSEERFKPFFEVIHLKSDRSVFTNKGHAMNKAGYKVKLSKG